MSREILEEMNRLLAHRGPDGEGTSLFEGPDWRVGLAHRRLAVLDLSERANQPMTTSCERCCTYSSASSSHSLWMTYNGELYNYQELRKTLKEKGHTFQSESDSEVVLHLYGEHGVQFLEKLNGMFALAIFDGRVKGVQSPLERGDILIARDEMGIKPLYYSELNNSFLFASELKALMASPEVSRELDFNALESYLTFLWAPAPLTPLKSIRKFEPGEARIIRKGRTTYRFNFSNTPEFESRSKARELDLKNELFTEINSAVKRQLMSDVPVGAFLSGGLDSSTIVAMMRESEQRKEILCYTMAGDESQTLEGCPQDLPYARQAARHLGVSLSEIPISAPTPEELQKTIYHLDEPLADPAAFNVLLISEQAKKDGVKVLLSGAGGDDVFSGYRRHTALFTETYSQLLPTSFKKQVALFARHSMEGGKSLPLAKNHLLRRALKAFAYMDHPEDERLVSYFNLGTPKSRHRLFSKSAIASFSGPSSRELVLENLKKLSPKTAPLDRMLHLEMKHFLSDFNLNYTDKMSMAAGIEVRVPFLDRELVGFSRTIPARLKQNRFQGKYLLKKAMSERLPSKIIYRKKTGFGGPVRNWMKGEMKGLVADCLSESSLKKRGIFSPAAVRTLEKQSGEGTVDGGYTLFSLVCTEIWCRTFLDKSAPAPL